MSLYADYAAWLRAQAPEKARQEVQLRVRHRARRLVAALRAVRQAAFELFAAFVEAALEAFGINGSKRVEQLLRHRQGRGRCDQVPVQLEAPFAAWWRAQVEDGESWPEGNGGGSRP